MKVSILTPMTDLIPQAFFNSYLSLFWRLTWDADIEVDFQTTAMKPIEISRNELVKRALEVNPDYILFLDADHSFESNLFYRLYEKQKDIVSALTFQKVRPFYPHARIKNKQGKFELLKKWEKNELLKIDGVGMACILLKADVFRKIPEPWFEFITNDTDRKGKLEYGEDIWFCKKLEEKGYDIWLDTSTIVRHIGGDGVGLESYLGSPAGKIAMEGKTP